MCHSFVINLRRTDSLKVEDIASMINTFDRCKFYDISDILRIFYIRAQLLKRNFAEIGAPFLKIYQHQAKIIKEKFELAGKKPFEVG